MPYLYLIPKRKDKPDNSIKCECGMEILVIPDVAEMANAIEDHVWEHIKNEKDPAKAEQESDRLSDLLIAQVFQVVTESNPVNDQPSSLVCPH